MCQFGFSQSRVDYTLFTKRHGKVFTAILIYVNDLVITGNDSTAIAEVKAYLSEQFHTKNLGHLSYFLGLEVFQTAEGFFFVSKKICKRSSS